MILMPLTGRFSVYYNKNFYTWSLIQNLFFMPKEKGHRKINEGDIVIFLSMPTNDKKSKNVVSMNDISNDNYCYNWKSCREGKVMVYYNRRYETINGFDYLLAASSMEELGNEVNNLKSIEVYKKTEMGYNWNIVNNKPDITKNITNEKMLNIIEKLKAMGFIFNGDLEWSELSKGFEINIKGLKGNNKKCNIERDFYINNLFVQVWASKKRFIFTNSYIYIVESPFYGHALYIFDNFNDAKDWASNTINYINARNKALAYVIHKEGWKNRINKAIF